MSFELYEYKIEDLGKVITGKTPPSKISDAFSAQGIPFVTPKDMDGRRLIDKTERYLSSQGVEAVRNCLLPQNSIAVSCIGSDMGKTVLLPGESITNQQINAIVVDSEHFDYKYVYYYLSTLQDDFKAIAGGSATPILNKGHFSQFKVSLPVKPVQNKIALILDSLDTKIEVNTEINHTLEQMAQALFKSWFVDFEPVKAKMAVLEAGGSQEDATLAAMTVISGKDSDALVVFEREHPEQYAELKATAELFPSAMQDSELGEIPEGWSIKPLDGIATYQNGLALQKFRPENENDFLPVVKIAQLKKGFSDGEEKASPNIKPECIIDNGDVVFSWSGSLMVDIWCGGKAALNQHLFKVSSTKYPKWLYYKYTAHHLIEFQRIAEAKAVTMGHIKREHLSQAKCLMPSSETVHAFTPFFEPVLNKVISNRLETRKLENIRDTLLPKLLSGEITLPEAEQAVSEVENV
ncbi:restriction endonuclease subunit S [Escherichia coli]|uniref:restriction endonuclease subunit S n=1 Tax=Escherichia coli TaxID=562 RepID=UPI00106DA6B5|nr:restriction endonuclease subunit S [Escherichia coli]EFK4095300.1 restriction endonuclease subunit S [Escherichia coli]EFN8012311.1 restriction endonuclease subunit S [Escherichia coli]EGD1873732.1 restriction endonuclease subunit S [Escherichia coli]EIH8433779.1 restriction endonuclease subunit S [Escherichia coli]EIW7138832.1 restriction endonuclease subunit S [Escherichia coli]